eukprot:gene7702-biopygen29876
MRALASLLLAGRPAHPLPARAAATRARPPGACTIHSATDATPGDDLARYSNVTSPAACAALCAADCRCAAGVYCNGSDKELHKHGW